MVNVWALPAGRRRGRRPSPRPATPGVRRGGRRGPAGAPWRTGLHSSTFQLNLSAFCGIGGACSSELGGIRGCWGGTRLCALA